MLGGLRRVDVGLEYGWTSGCCVGVVVLGGLVWGPGWDWLCWEGWSMDGRVDVVMGLLRWEGWVGVLDGTGCAGRVESWVE